jgi:hypothetical protein
MSFSEEERLAVMARLPDRLATLRLRHAQRA